MEEGAGLNSEVLARGKKFHVQTNYLEPVEKIISNIFDNGKVIYKKELQMEESSSTGHVKELVDTIHKEMVAEIELLFYISEKVRTIKHATSNNKLGVVFYQKNLYEEAINEFKIAIEINPEFAEAYKNLGFLYLKNNQFSEASKTLKIGLEKQSNYPDLHYVLGCVFVKQQNYADAISEFNAAIKINPDYAEAHFNLGLGLLKSIAESIENKQLPNIQERKNLAISHLQKAESFVESDRLIEAYEYFNEDDINKTVDILDRVKEDSHEKLKTDIEDEFYLKFMFGGKGKDDEFINDYVTKVKAAIEKYPKYADLRNDLGIAYLIQCRNLFLNALDEFRQAQKINPDFRSAKKNLRLAENDGRGFLILLRAILK